MSAVRDNYRYGNTHLLRSGMCWCYLCRQQRPAVQGAYKTLPDGKRQRWICFSCLPETARTQA